MGRWGHTKIQFIPDLYHVKIMAHKDKVRQVLEPFNAVAAEMGDLVL